MNRSTLLMGLAGATGVPVWAVPDAHAVLGSVLFWGLTGVAGVLCLTGVAFWYADGK